MPKSTPVKNQSAGLLLVREAGADMEVLLGHPGGPFWSKKDSGAWTIPKGLIAPGESPLAAARREFVEETGHDPKGRLVPLGDAKQPEERSFTCGPFVKIGTQVYCAAIHSRWNGRQSRASAELFLNSTAWAGFRFRKLVRRF
jgi:predicted NUDIX family NTP pyrophosphohydrolase